MSRTSEPSRNETPDRILVVDPGGGHSSFLLPDTSQGREVAAGLKETSRAEKVGVVSILALMLIVLSGLAYVAWHLVRFVRWLWLTHPGPWIGPAYPATTPALATVGKGIVAAFVVACVVFAVSAVIPRPGVRRFRATPGAHDVPIPAQRLRRMPEIGGLPAALFFWLAADAGELDAELIDGVLKSIEKSEQEQRLRSRIESIAAAERERRES